MTTETIKQRHQNTMDQGGGSDAVYGIGLIGAWVYYFRRATTNQECVQAFFKGFVGRLF